MIVYLTLLKFKNIDYIIKFTIIVLFYRSVTIKKNYNLFQILFYQFNENYSLDNCDNINTDLRYQHNFY